MVPKDADTFLAGACPIVGSYGAKDWTLRGAAERLERALSANGVEHDVKQYPGAGHAFLNDHHDPLFQAMLRIVEHRLPRALRQGRAPADRLVLRRPPEISGGERDRSECVRRLGKTPPFRGPHGEVVPGSIAEVAYRRLGGARSMGDDPWRERRQPSVDPAARRAGLERDAVLSVLQRAAREELHRRLLGSARRRQVV